jgi:shikimate kinase / 3-dehydroquinate synthase
MMIVLVGFMGSGKSSAGRGLARLLGTAFADTDEMIEERTGESIASIFERGGEQAFRDLERLVVADALAGPAEVVALGGGAVTDATTRELLSTASIDVVHLKLPLGEALERVGDGTTRPMLSQRDPAELYTERTRIYESVATCTVDVAGRSTAEVATEIADRLGRGQKRVGVSSGSGDYDVIVGRDLLTRLADFLPERVDPENAFVITHPTLSGLARPAVDSLASRGVRTRVVTVPEGESSKTLEVAEHIFSRFAESAAHRGDLVVSVGGGVVTDLAGFAASTFNRGMPLIHAPTSLLAQVDAAIGGKTGVNLPQAKNLVGSFYPPAIVVADTAALDSLPSDELRSGMAEVVKYGLIADPALLSLLGDRAGDILAFDAALLEEVVLRSVAIKARIVSTDEHEAGVRAHLNYGHTFGHAVEAASGFEGKHGEAISIGMMAAAHLARVMGRIDEDVVTAHRDALSALGLPMAARLDLAELERAWLRDKKFDRTVRFVLLAGLGRPEAGIPAAREDIIEALKRLES